MDINMDYGSMIKQINLWQEMEIFDKLIKMKEKEIDKEYYESFDWFWEDYDKEKAKEDK